MMLVLNELLRWVRSWRLGGLFVKCSFSRKGWKGRRRQKGEGNPTWFLRPFFPRRLTKCLPEAVKSGLFILALAISYLATRLDEGTQWINIGLIGVRFPKVCIIASLFSYFVNCYPRKSNFTVNAPDRFSYSYSNKKLNRPYFID